MALNELSGIRIGKKESTRRFVESSQFILKTELMLKNK